MSNSMADKLTQIAANSQLLYNAGYEKGKSESGTGGYEQGVADGKAEVYAEIEAINAQLENTLNGTDTGGKSFYDEFWDEYQENGNRTDYATSFAGDGWDEQTFKPKYDMTPYNAYMMFRGNAMKIDLVEYLNNLGIKLDFSKSTETGYLFDGAAFTRLGIIDVSGASANVPIGRVFNGCVNLLTIDKVVLKNGTTGKFDSSAFSRCSSLENVTFEGLISNDGLDMRWSTKLSKASITNIIEHLSTTTSGLAVTLSKVAVNKAFETSEGANDGTTSTEWITIIGTRSNWTISLV